MKHNFIHIKLIDKTNINFNKILEFFKLSVGSTFGYTFQSVLGTAILGALLELVMEVVFSPIGYKICKKWKNEDVGSDYRAYCDSLLNKEVVSSK